MSKNVTNFPLSDLNKSGTEGGGLVLTFNMIKFHKYPFFDYL